MRSIFCADDFNGGKTIKIKRKGEKTMKKRVAKQYWEQHWQQVWL